MKFWKVLFSGKKDQTVLTDCGGSYTVSATDKEKAQEEAASMAHQDGVTKVSIESCAPLQNEEAWTSEGFTSATNYTPFCSTSSHVVLNGDDNCNSNNATCTNSGYVAYATVGDTTPLYNCDPVIKFDLDTFDDDEDWYECDEDWDDFDDEPVYVSYTSLRQQVGIVDPALDQTCTANTSSGYTAYNGYTTASKVFNSSSNNEEPPKAYQEPWANGYYNYKITNRINLTKNQALRVRELV